MKFLDLWDTKIEKKIYAKKKKNHIRQYLRVLKIYLCPRSYMILLFTRKNTRCSNTVFFFFKKKKPTKFPNMKQPYLYHT